MSDGIVRAGLGITFSPAGLLTPFHIGVCSALQQRGLLSQGTVLAGASGGALAAISAKFIQSKSYTFEDLLQSCDYIAQECTLNGTRKTLRTALDTVLERIIPLNAIDYLYHPFNNSDVAPVYIAYKQVFPYPSNENVNKFTDRSELIDTLRASCNIPFYFNGNNPFVQVRGGYGIDGFFAVDRNRFGCPNTHMSYELFITPFPPSLVGLRPKLARRKILQKMYNKKYVSNSIPQDLATESQKGDLFGLNSISYDSILTKFQAQIDTKETADDSDIDFLEDELESESTLTKLFGKYDYDIISPELLSPEEWPYDLTDLLSLALRPPSIRSLYKSMKSDMANEMSDNRLKSIWERLQRLSVFDQGRLDETDEVNAKDLSEDDKVSLQSLNNEYISLIYRSLFDCGARCVEKWLEKDRNHAKIRHYSSLYW